MTTRRTGKWLGLPYDVRRPILGRVRERTWNPADPRFFTPKAYGWGLGINLYWVAHPVRWRRANRR